MADIKHPLVRHRLTLFQKLLQQLVSRFGEPDMIVLEAIRSLAMGEKKRREHIQRIKENRDERESIRTELKKDNFSSSKNSILRYRLFKEAKGRCPFCLCPFCLQEVVSVSYTHLTFTTRRLANRKVCIPVTGLLPCDFSTQKTRRCFNRR